MGHSFALKPNPKTCLLSPKTNYVYTMPRLILHVQKFSLSNTVAEWGEIDHTHQGSLWQHVRCKAILPRRGWRNRKGLRWELNEREHQMTRSPGAICPFCPLLSCPWDEPASSPCNLWTRRVPTFNTCWSHYQGKIDKEETIISDMNMGMDGIVETETLANGRKWPQPFDRCQVDGSPMKL